MRRDYFELDVSNVAWVSDEGKPKKPRVEIDFYGPSAELKRQLSKPSGEYLDASETDVTFRLQDDVNESDASGVVSVTNRITGDFILELNQRAEDVLSFINAHRVLFHPASSCKHSAESQSVIRTNKGPF